MKKRTTLFDWSWREKPCEHVKGAYFQVVKATLTELHTDTGKVLDTVIQGHQSVELTQHGKTVAEIRPKPQPMSPEEFVRLCKSRRPLGKDLADEIAAAIKQIDEAE